MYTHKKKNARETLNSSRSAIDNSDFKNYVMISNIYTLLYTILIYVTWRITFNQIPGHFGLSIMPRNLHRRFLMHYISECMRNVAEKELEKMAYHKDSCCNIFNRIHTMAEIVKLQF